MAAEEESMDVEDAENRWEKRMIQKSVRKRAKELKTQDNRRISKLVQDAMKWDPRLRMEKERREEEEKERGSEDREESSEIGWP